MNPEDVALLREYVRINGDGNVVGTDNKVTIVKQIAGDYAIQIQIGQVQVNVTLSIDDLRKLLEPRYTPPPPPSPDSLPDPGLIPPGYRLPDRNALFTGRVEPLLCLARTLLYEPVAATLVAKAIQGMGGVGKTQLVVEFAHRYGRYFCGVHWLNAAQPDALDDEVAKCGTAMSLPNWPERRPEQVACTLVKWQSGGPRLVILDNLEAVDAARKWLAPLRGSPVRLLITTRRRDWPDDLGLSVLRLDLFAPMESRVFLRKHLPNDSDNDLDTLANRLGHLPLALELAGRFLRRNPHLGVDTYLQEMEQILAHPSMKGWKAYLGNPTGHDLDLAETFAVSYRALEAEEQRLFRTLGSFAPAPFNPVHVAVVLGWNTSATESRLDNLVELSLVQREKNDSEASAREGGERSCYALHPLLHDYAEMLLKDTKENETIRAAHAAHYLAYVHAHGKLTAADYDALEIELRNILAAMDWAYKSQDWQRAVDFALALRHLFAAHGYWQEGQERLEKAIVASKRIRDRAAPAKLELALGLILFRQDKFQEAKRQLESSLRLSRQIEDTVTEQKSLYNLGLLLADGDEPEPGRYESALSPLRESLELAQALSESAWTAVVMSKQQIAKCCTLLQRYAEAAKHLEDCQKIYKSKGINDERLHAYTHYFLGLNFHWQEKLTEARCHYEQDLKISYGQRWEIIYMQGSESSERPKDPVHVGEPLTNLAEVLYAQGDRNKARTLLHHARKYAEMFQNKELLEYQKVIQQKIDGRVDTSEGDGHETKESSS